MRPLTIRWIGQSGYLLSDGETEICIDPYLSNAVDRVAGRGRMVESPFAPEVLASDAVVCTHDHLDHLDIDAIPRMRKEKMLFLAPTHAHKTLQACGVKEPLPFDEDAAYEIGAFRLLAVFADHTVPAVGVLVEHGGYTLYFSGDTEYHERLTALADRKIDVMLVCINGRLGNMNADEAVTLTERLSPRVGIPTHYGMFESNTEDPEKYLSRVASGFELKYNVKYPIEEVLANV